MSLMGRLLGAFPGKASAVASHISAFTWGATGGLNAIWTPRRYDRMAEEGYKKSAIAMRCIDSIAKGVCITPILVYQIDAEGNRREVPNHWVTQLMRQPNPTQSRAKFLYELVSFLLIAGNAYVEGVGPDTGENAGQYRELWGKRPDRMKVIPGRFGVAGYTHEVNGHIMEWPVDPLTMKSRIKHFTLFNPTNDWYGMSPLEVAAMDVDTHNQTRTWNKSLLDNGARPPGALVTDKALSPKQRDDLKADIRERSGASRVGAPLLLEAGLKWEQFGLSPRDMDFLESKNTSARDICTAFDVPPMLLGIPGDNTYSNQREARVAFYDNTVQFYISMVVDELSAWLFPPGSDLVLGYDLDQVPAMAYRREQMFDRATKAYFLKVNEQRELVGYGKMEKQDEKALENDPGEVVLVPSAMKPLSQALQPPPDPIAVAAARAGAGAAPGAPGGPPARPRPTGPKPNPPMPRGKDEDLRGTLRHIRDELGLSKMQLALWLTGEGYDEQRAEEMAALTEGD